MKRIATLSFHNAYNYGAVFQVSALQEILSRLEIDCDIIDYRNKSIDNQYSFKPLRFDKKFFMTLRLNLTLFPFIKKKKANFQQYDKFIVGSDQVWNMECHGGDTTFFLDFVKDNSKKIAYAASFGSYYLSDDWLGIYKKFIPLFSAISVREDRGVELVKELTSKSVTCCMDPVLLIGREYWESRMPDYQLTDKSYIFVYQLGHEKKTPLFVKHLRHETKLNVIFITGHIGNMIHYSFKDKNMSSASPEKFLWLLSHASYVVTNSFHATVLSMLFRKNFSVVIEGDEKATFNSRIYSLLSKFDMTDRLFDFFDRERVMKDVNFARFNCEYKNICASSIGFLKTSIFC